MNIKRTFAGINSFILFIALSSGCLTGQKSSGIYNNEGSHEICNEYNDWIKRATAYDSEKRIYYAYTCKDRIVFLAPYSTLLYSRDGNVVGFQRDGVFHFHAPSKGWKDLDVSGVGKIMNVYEGEDDYPDLSMYKTPPTLVK